MSTSLIVISDGRDCHAKSIVSAMCNLVCDWDEIIHVDDIDHDYGFAGAIQRAWDMVETDWVFHLEADFLFNEPVYVDDMIGVLERNPYLAQLVLKRQSWNEEEKRAGGIIEQHPMDYLERGDGVNTWTEHRRFWSTNPSVYSSRFSKDWPQVPHSEGIFTHRLLEDPIIQFAFWGAKADPPKVEHIGQRAGVGY
ncbi:MAG: glycosyltransferase [Solirubrobacteraceae bacterium]